MFARVKQIQVAFSCLSSRQKTLWIILIVLLIGLADYLIGTELSTSVFYLAPLALAAWYGSPRSSYLMAVLCGAVWLMAEYPAWSSYSERWTPLWNASVRILTFVAFSRLLSSLKALHERELERAQLVKLRAELKLNEEQYRSLIEGLRDTYSVQDAEGRLSYCSPAIAASLGYDATDLLGMPALQLVARRDRARVARLFRRALEEGREHVYCEFRCRARDGREFWVEQFTHILHGGPASAVEYRSISRDISERRAAEQHIRLLASALESTTEMVSVTDHQNRFVYVNRAFLEAYGYDSNELIGLTPAVLLPPGTDHVVPATLWAETIRGGWRGELTNRRKDGSMLPIALAASPILDSEGAILGYLGVSRDISDLRAARTALSRAEQGLQDLFAREEARPIQEVSIPVFTSTPARALQEITDRIHRVTRKMQEDLRQAIMFSSLAAHELRTPLAVLRHETAAALEGGGGEQDMRKTLTSVHEEVARLAQTVETFLLVGSLRARAIQPRFDLVEAGQLVRQLHERAAPLFQERGITIILEECGDARISGDADLLREVLLNLVDNAAKHAGACACVWISCRVEGEVFAVTVRDRGIGIPQKEHERIFEPFQRAEEGGTDRPGTGLGLVLVKAVVQAHRGSIEIRSDGSGTTVVVRLPLGRSRAEAGSAPDPAGRDDVTTSMREF